MPKQTSTESTIALNMIVKDCQETLPGALMAADFVGFDEVVIVDTGSTDGTPDIAKARADTFRTYNAPLLDIGGKKVLSDFAGAREYAKSLSTTDYIFYLDSDDTIFNPVGLREFLREKIRSNEHDGCYVDYDYEHDAFGNCILRHQTIRCAHRLSHFWRSPIHEVLCAIHTPAKCFVPTDLARIVHVGAPADRAAKSARNAAVAEHWINHLGEENVEPRLWLNYGKSLQAIGRSQEAIDAIHRYLDGSQWNEERYYAYLFAAAAWMDLEMYENAFRELFAAVRLFPKYRDAYLDLAKCAELSGEYQHALAFADMIDTVEDESGYQVNPYAAAVGSSRVRAAASFHVHDFEECVRQSDAILANYPHDAEVMNLKITAAHALRRKELIDAYRTIEFVVAKEGNPEKLDHLDLALPRALENEPEFSPAVQVDTSKRRVAFICGESPEPWGFDSHLRGGIGGSETAVIHLSRELAARGFSVEVYGYPNEQQDGLHDGVLWLPYWRFRNAPTPDVLVAWRTPEWVFWDQRARARYIWLHDVQAEHGWRPEIWEAANGVLFLSKAHRRTAPFIPEEKVWYSANGLDPSFFVDGKNDPHRVVYASGPDRGLDLLLAMWPEVKKARPKARLDIYYGFSPLFRQSMQASKHYRGIYERVVSRLNQPGVHWHGRVPQNELAEAFAAAGVWSYPTSFFEISCITAMQAQANGAVPVSTSYAALAETVKFGRLVGNVGDRIEDDEGLQAKYLESLIELIGNKKEQEKCRAKMVPWARENFLWSKVAEDWATRFKKDLKRSSSQTPLAASS